MCLVIRGRIVALFASVALAAQLVLLVAASSAAAAAPASQVDVCYQHVSTRHFACLAIRRADLGFTPTVTVYTQATTQIVVDVSGYVGSSA